MFMWISSMNKDDDDDDDDSEKRARVPADKVQALENKVKVLEKKVEVPENKVVVPDYQGEVPVIKVPSGISGYESKNYAAVQAMFEGVGFTNVKCVPLNDLITGLLTKPGMVDSIVINGKAIGTFRKKYPANASVVISYHSFSKR